MLQRLPTTKLKANLRNRFDNASIPKIQAMTWLNYQLFLKRLAKAAADKAKEDKSAVIRKQHVKAAAKSILRGNKG